LFAFVHQFGGIVIRLVSEIIVVMRPPV